MTLASSGLHLFPAVDELQRAEEAGGITDRKQLFRLAPVAPSPPSSFGSVSVTSTVPSSVTPRPARPPVADALVRREWAWMSPSVSLWMMATG